MDWFERLTGFRELNYTQTRCHLGVSSGELYSLVNNKRYGIGELELVSLDTLRQRIQAGPGLPGRLKVSALHGDVRSMHSEPGNAGALFQVASQFNLLEMMSPNRTPEHGVTGYQDDGTQGPACAMAAGAATIYRNYFANIDDQEGQTRERQLDGLADMGHALGKALQVQPQALWIMRNGYAMCTEHGLSALDRHLAGLAPVQIDALRGMLRIGVHSQVEVTDRSGPPAQYVSQAFCSALPVSYAEHSAPPEQWEAFATLILEAAYEATLSAAILNAQMAGSNVVLLTRLGGGVFGNDGAWIDAAMGRAFRLFAHSALDVRIVSYNTPTASTLKFVSEFQ